VILLRHGTLGRTPLDEGSAERPLPDNNQRSQEIDIHALGGSEPPIPGSERPQTHALDRAAAELGTLLVGPLLIL